MKRIDCRGADWRAGLDELSNRPAYPPEAEKAAAAIIARLVAAEEAQP